MKTQSKEQSATANRREQIIQAAGRLFSERGIYPSRIDDVAATAGVGKGTVYWYFSSKDEVVLAVIEEFFDRAHEGLAALVQEPGTVAERLHDYVRSHAAQLIEQPHLAALAAEFYALAPREPKVRELLESYYDGWTDATAKMFDQGVERDELQTEDTRLSATTLIELIDGATLNWTATAGRFDLAQRFHQAVDVVVRPT